MGRFVLSAVTGRGFCGNFFISVNFNSGRYLFYDSHEIFADSLFLGNGSYYNREEIKKIKGDILNAEIRFNFYLNKYPQIAC